MPPSTLHPDEIAAAQFVAATMSECLTLDYPKLHVPAIANKLQVRSERLHKWLNPADVIHNLPLHMLFQWHDELGASLFFRIADRLQYDLVSRIQPTSKQDALTLVLGLLPQLGHTLLAVAPYLDKGQCPHAQRRELKQATLRLTTSLHSLNHWASPPPPAPCTTEDAPRTARPEIPTRMAHFLHTREEWQAALATHGGTNGTY